ncbi:MAG TPA: glycoside hydrolase family 44 protein [Kofleriaceae bacterium]|jgi:mannan endo-1,4-beta-mannosidase
MRWAICVLLVACGGGHGTASGDAPADPDGSEQTGAYCPTGTNTTSTGGAQITLDVDLAQLTPVSDYIYGINNYPEANYSLNYPNTQFGMMRWGGDSYSAWNWATNATNGGRDNGFTNTDQFMPFAYGSDPADPAYHDNPHDPNVGGAVVDGSDALHAGLPGLVTVSVQDYVAANANDQTVAYAPSADFTSNSPSQAGAQVTFFQAVGAAFYELDNEPNYWSGTHPEVFGTNDLSFDELVARDTTYAAAIKVAAPSALVFGPVVAGVDGMTSLDDYGDLAATNPYAATGVDAISYYLAHVATASRQAGTRLVDVLDLHYYNDTKDKAGTPKTDEECAQGPRDFWDPSYSTVDTSYDDYITGWKPRRLIPRMTDEIAASYAGTRLAFTEYNNGCEQSIGGGVAEADTLGVFGQYGVFAATAWPLQPVTPGTSWLVGAFGAYRNYDGNGATVGSLATTSVSSDIATASVYGFAAPNGVPTVQIVAINRTAAPVTAEIRLSNACALTSAQPYQLTSGSAAMVSAGGPIAITDNAFAYTLPALSVTTFALRSY